MCPIQTTNGTSAHQHITNTLALRKILTIMSRHTPTLVFFVLYNTSIATFMRHTPTLVVFSFTLIIATFLLHTRTLVFFFFSFTIIATFLLHTPGLGCIRNKTLVFTLRRLIPVVLRRTLKDHDRQML